MPRKGFPKKDSNEPEVTTEEYFASLLLELEASEQILDHAAKELDPHKEPAKKAITALKAKFVAAMKKATGMGAEKRKAGQKAPPKPKTAMDQVDTLYAAAIKKVSEAVASVKAARESVETAQIGLSKIVAAADETEVEVKKIQEAREAAKKAAEEAAKKAA